MQAIDQSDDPLQPQVPGLGESLQQGRMAQQPAPGFDPGKLHASWQDWVNKPNNRAALMQFGIAMLQPLGMGETGLGHFGSAVGAAGQAAENVTTQEQRERKLQSESDTRETRARAAETSANAAEMRAGFAGENARLRSENAQTSNLARNLQAQARARSEYDRYVDQVNKRNVDPLRDTNSPLETPMGFPEWLRSSGGAAASSASELEGGGGGPRPKGSWESLQHDPKIQAAATSVRQAIASGDPQMTAKAKQYLDTYIAPHVDPSEMSQVYNSFGLR